MTTILTGTSGYSYTEWIGPVYPQGSRPEMFLRLYAAEFPTVELNFSYYRMPTAGQLSRLIEQSGDRCTFSIKAHESLTHTVDPGSWRLRSKEFKDALGPLIGGKRLECVLLQFPYSFHYDVDRRKYLDSLLRDMDGLPLAVEFRNGTWCNNRVLDALGQRKVAFVSADLPPLDGLPPIVDAVTADFAYIRMHGRNTETWWGSDAAARYDYLYSDAELKTWAVRLRAIAPHVRKILVYFNNHRRGQAVANARTFAKLVASMQQQAP